MSLIVGVTGGIGCGKSTVAQLFRNLGVETLDADDLARKLSAPDGKVYPEIIALFGNDILLSDKTLDRALIRQRIFAQPELRQQLESILHPHITEEAAQCIAQWQGAYGLLIVPLLLEKPNLRRLVNRILVVDCLESQQIARVVTSRDLCESDVRAIMATQYSREQRHAQADDIIDNSGAYEDLLPQIDKLDNFYRSFA
ncbi:MAG: dephospho-CoA kinase [Burkholderiales bacterium]|jgi:dephospho-CoA kinase|nr:dephospho-CoA kinase [Burkholderiales bacterium]